MSTYHAVLTGNVPIVISAPTRHDAENQLRSVAPALFDLRDGDVLELEEEEEEEEEEDEDLTQQNSTPDLGQPSPS